jgi:hypothetical protein
LPVNTFTVNAASEYQFTFAPIADKAGMVDEPKQAVCEVAIVAVGNGFTVIVTLAVAVQAAPLTLSVKLW